MLYLQLDNTARQCKAKYVMAYLKSLVAAGVFKKIVVSFLPVGHTLEDIDLIHLSLVIIRFLAIIISCVLLWSALEIVLLIARSNCKAAWIRNYKRQIEDDWSTAAKSQRGITY